MTIIDRLKLILERVNLTPGNFADKIGVAPATISHILSGRNKYPSAEVMLRLHETFPDIDLNWLLTGEGTLVKDDPDSMFTGSLFGDNLLNATKSTTESENRKENSLETAKNTDNPIVKHC